MIGLFFVYILKASVCLAVFYLFYRLLLSRETFHRFNRLALLGLMLLSCLLPLMEVTVQDTTDVVRPFLSLEEMLLADGMGVGSVVVATAEAEVPFSWREGLLLVYGLGVLFFLMRHVWSLTRMIRLIRRCHKERMEGGITLYTHREKVAPFSWMRNIVISEEDLQENGRAILTHERGHIRHLHSWDLLLAEGCIFFQWFNPAAWLLKQELQNIHEYEADEWVIQCGVDARTYQLLLIKKAVGARLYSIANSFNHSSLKKRITMMIKKKSNPWARLKYLYVLPLAAVAVVAFARPEVSKELDEISSVKVSDFTEIIKTEKSESAENLSDQRIKVSGTVLEEGAKIPVVGAGVLVKGSTNGTLTNPDGRFTLYATRGSVLQISFKGYQTASVQVPEEGKPLTVWMKPIEREFTEMSVVGYAMNGIGSLDKSTGKRVLSVVGLPQVKETPVEVQMEEGEEERVFQIVEDMPQFPGGMRECMLFLGRNIHYPVSAQMAGMEGRVIVQFVVRKDGHVSDVKVVRGVSPELDSEALRVMEQMPVWTPGRQRGKAVDVKYTLPINFTLKHPEKSKTQS